MERVGAHTTRYISSLDGLRAFAVIAVMLYHLNVGWAQGGLLGVTVFFVLSGYLITGILTTELSDSSTIRLGKFWVRRIRRLFPAIVTCVLVVAVLCIIFNHVLFTKMRPDIIPSLFWFNNWWYVFRDLSYFDQIGDPSPLLHFWSLAIEEQFYLVWPCLLLLVFKGYQRFGRGGSFKVIVRRGCLVLAVVSAVLMAVLYEPDADPSRVYYGTDTRAFSLLLGGWLSFVWPGQKLTEENTAHVPASTMRTLDIAGVAAFAGIIVIMVTVDGFSSFYYYGGLFLVSVLTAVVIAVLVHPRSLFAKVASLRPFTWIGERSYGMYLWHFPTILLLKPMCETQDYPWWFILLVFAVTFAVAGLSYKFIETPIRRGLIGQLIGKIREGSETVLTILRRYAVPVVAFVLLAGTTIVGCAAVPETTLVPEDAIVSTGSAVDQAMVVSGPEELQPAAEEPAPEEAAPEEAVAEEAPAEEAASAEALPFELPTNFAGVVTGWHAMKAQVDAEAAAAAAAAEAEANRPHHEEGVYNPVLIGDSVPGDANDAFMARFPYGLNDSYISRLPRQSLEVYQGYVDQGVVGHVVVFACFSNHMVQEDDLQAIIDTVGPDKELYLVNAYVPLDWMAAENETLQAYADRYDNVHVIDWASVCDGHAGEYLWDDATHLRPEGAEVYMQTIEDAIAPSLPPEDMY